MPYIVPEWVKVWCRNCRHYQGMDMRYQERCAVLGECGDGFPTEESQQTGCLVFQAWNESPAGDEKR